MYQGCWKVDEHDEGKSGKYERTHKFSHELWNEMYTSKATGSKAIFIDVEEEEDDDDKVYSKWSDLPDLLLEKIFSYLSIRERYYASLVCKSWSQAFYLPYVWSEFVLEDTTLTRGRFNYYSGWQYVLDHLRAQLCLTNVGRNFKKLTFQPMLNFYNLYEFMNMLSWYNEQWELTGKEDYAIGQRIHTLKFTFSCNMTTRDDSERVRLFGTGGKLLAALKRLMSNLRSLERLELIDLMLDPHEAKNLLDGVCETRYLGLKTLSLVNTTRVHYQLLHVGVFLNLQVLIISPQNLGDDVIELLSHTNLKHLHILQNRYSPNDISISQVSPKTWRECKKNLPTLQVHLQLESKTYKPLIGQEEAPVVTMLYDSPHIGVGTDDIWTAVESYKNHLKVFGHLNIPRFYRSKSFPERIDTNLMILVRNCRFLKVLVITERISTGTAILLVHTGKNLEKLYIRGNAVILRCEWPQSADWSDDFYETLKLKSKSYKATEEEISQVFGYKWKFLSDKEFKRLSIDLHNL